MLKFITRIAYNFKEYCILVVLLVISLFLLSKNESPQAKHLHTFALGNFAVLSEITNSITSVFIKNVSVEELRRENAELMLEVNRLRKYRLENDQLHSMMAFKDTSKYPLVAAEVVSKLITKIQGNLIINKGSAGGIQKGMPVLDERGLIGLIMDVTENFSVVRTLNNSNMNIAVTVQRNNLDGILNYDGNKLLIKNIPVTQDVQVGDLVETSDFSSLFPPYIPVGVIKKKESNTLGLLHSLTVQTFADISGADNLFVLKVVPSKQIDQLEMNLLKKD